MNQEQLISQPWLQELQEDVQQELNRQSEESEDSTESLGGEAKQLQNQCERASEPLLLGVIP